MSRWVAAAAVLHACAALASGDPVDAAAQPSTAESPADEAWTLPETSPPPPPPSALRGAASPASPRDAVPPERSPAPAPAPAPSPTREHRKNRITFGPVTLFLGWIPLEYERAVGEHVSLFFAPQLRPTSGIFLLIPEYGWGGRVGGGVRWFPVSRAPEGFWAGMEVLASYDYFEATTQGRTETTTTYTAVWLGMVGFTATTANGFSLSFGVGLGSGWNDTDNEATAPPEPPEDIHAFLPQLGLHANIGWAF